jgi:ATP-binding cassette, subfamily G (WHITE), member 2
MDGMVKKTLRSLGLTDVRKNRIGTYFQRGISGGQKRRVTIASSVVTQPRIFLCDEPTSGLDSMTGYQVACASE